MAGVAAVGGLSAAAAGYLPQTAALSGAGASMTGVHASATHTGLAGQAGSLGGIGMHAAGLSQLAQSLGQLGIQGAVGQQVMSLAANFQQTPKSELLGALLIALLLNKSDDDHKKNDSATNLFMAMALMGAMQSNGMSSGVDMSVTNHVGGIAGATAMYAASSGAAPIGQGFSGVG